MLVDTDIFIWLTRGSAVAAEFLDSLDSIAISDMTYIELIQGTKNKQEMRMVRMWLEAMGVERIAIDPVISAKAAELVEQYAHSHSLHAADSLIAATALVYELPLATGNVKHFSPVADLDLHKFSVQSSDN